jgi:hypothetical protein
MRCRILHRVAEHTLKITHTTINFLNLEISALEATWIPVAQPKCVTVIVLKLNMVVGMN